MVCLREIVGPIFLCTPISKQLISEAVRGKTEVPQRLTAGAEEVTRKRDKCQPRFSNAVFPRLPQTALILSFSVSKNILRFLELLSPVTRFESTPLSALGHDASQLTSIQSEHRVLPAFLRLFSPGPCFAHDANLT